MSNEFQFLIYQSAEEDVSVDAFIQNETIWITANQMAVLFDKSESTIRKHINNVFDEGELDRENNTQKVRVDGVKQPVAFYNLDTIISVGYRVNSRRATQFRIWATSVLKEYMIKGFAMDDERLKQGKTAFGKDYFRELLERVRSIRASERRIWQQITDIFAECSIDYDKNAQVTHDFYAMVQNKFHFAITGQTAAEIVYTSADRTKENMGLTTWKNAPDGRILKSDVIVAKNYLEEKQIRQLERAVTGYFDYIEDLIERENTFTMEEFAASVNEFLAFRRYDILRDKGKISGRMANVLNYFKTKDIREGLKACKNEKARRAYREEHDSDFIILDAAKRYFDSKGLKKLPSYKALQQEIEQLIKEKNALYNEYHEAKDKDKELGTVRHNIDQILNGELTRKQEQKKKSQEQEI